MDGADSENDLDLWNLAAKYEVQGFTVAGSYNVIVDEREATGRTAGVAPQLLASDNFAPKLPDNSVPFRIVSLSRLIGVRYRMRRCYSSF